MYTWGMRYLKTLNVLILFAALLTPPVYADGQEEEILDPLSASRPIPDEMFLEKGKSIISEKVLLAAGYLSRNDHPFGHITGFREDKTTAIPGDVVFLDHGADIDMKVGDRYFIYTKGRTITFPRAKEPFGYLISIVGALEVREVSDRTSAAIVKQEYDVIPKGASIMPAFDVVSPKIDPDKPLDGKIINGEIVVTRYDKTTVSIGDVVYLNVGRSVGVSEGDVFEVTRKRAKRWYEFSFFSGPEQRGLDARIGALTIVMAKEDTSTAVIGNTNGEVKVGDKVSFIQSR